jgi:hypothetical protein
MITLPHHPEVCPGKEQLQFESGHADALIEDLPLSRLTCDCPKGMLHFGAQESLRRLNQI